MAFAVLPDWQDLVRLPEAQLGTIDIALVNLACAADLPSSVKIDPAFCLEKLDSWVRLVRQDTERWLPRFFSRPEEYRNSEAYFRALSMMTVLWKVCGVRYNEAKIPVDVPLDTEDSFIHGVIRSEGGTCASLPVVYEAVGRRLGYPIKLVSTACRAAQCCHLFCRWDGKGKYLNIDANHTGLTCDPDDAYRTGLFELSPDLERWNYFLKSQAPRDELAGFLAQRGCRQEELDQYRQAANSFAWALALQPGNRLYHNRVVRVCQTWGPSLLAQEPPSFPPLDFKWPPRRFPPSFPENMERAILGLEGWENVLKDPEHAHRWWGPMRRGQPLPARPVKVHIVHNAQGCEVGFEVVRTAPRW